MGRKEKFAFYLSPEKKAIMEQRCQEDRGRSITAFIERVEQGDLRVQYLMGQLYRGGPLLILDSRKAKHWLTLAAKLGLSEAQYALGKLLFSDDLEVRDPDEGIHWLKQATENRSRLAAYRLGKEYLSGGVRWISSHNRQRRAISMLSICWACCI